MGAGLPMACAGTGSPQCPLMPDCGVHGDAGPQRANDPRPKCQTPHHPCQDDTLPGKPVQTILAALGRSQAWGGGPAGLDLPPPRLKRPGLLFHRLDHNPMGMAQTCQPSTHRCMHRVAGSGVGSLELLRLGGVLGQLQPVHAFWQAAAGRVLPGAKGPPRQLCLQQLCRPSCEIQVGKSGSCCVRVCAHQAGQDSCLGVAVAPEGQPWPLHAACRPLGQQASNAPCLTDTWRQEALILRARVQLWETQQADEGSPCLAALRDQGEAEVGHIRHVLVRQGIDGELVRQVFGDLMEAAGMRGEATGVLWEAVGPVL